MKTLHKLLIIILFAPIAAHAQSNYKPGYVVNSKGDTTKGFIDYREWNSNPDAISFKGAIADNNKRTLTVGDIKSFSVTGLESYQRYEGPISMDDPNHNDLHKDTTVKTVVVFLKLLQAGSRVALYSYTDEIKTRFFIKDKSEQKPRELIYRIYNKPENVSYNIKVVTVKENIYFKQLILLAQKYDVMDDDLQDKIIHADYYKQNLVEIVSKINGISKAEYEAKYNEHTKLNFFLLAGVNSSPIRPYGNYQAVGGKASTSVSPAASFGAGIFADPNTKKLEFLVEFTVSADEYKSATIYTGSPYVPVRYSYDQVWIAFSPQVKYNFYNTQNFKIFAGAGIAFTYHDYYNGTYDINYANTHVTNAPLKYDNFLNNQSADSFFNKFGYPINVTAGMRFGQHIEIFGRYFTSSNVSQDYYFKVKYDNTQIGLGYQF